MFELKLAKQKDIPSLKYMWKLCFDDTDDFIDFFFEEIFPYIYPVALYHFENPIGMMYLFPVSVTQNNRIKKGFYVYAIGIHPDFRGKNIFENHINKPLFDYLLENDMFCILCPANEKLSAFYKKLQYKTMCILYKRKMYLGGNSLISSYKPLDSKQLYHMRKKEFDYHIIWHEKELDLILNSIRFSGGEAFIFEICGKSYYCITEKYDDNVTVIETNIKSEYFQDLCNLLCDKHSVKEVNIVCTNPKNSLRYFETLSFNLNSTEYYFNFAMQ